MATAAKKMDRIDLRIEAEAKQLCERAAHLSGFASTSEFYRTAAVEKAKEVISEAEVITLVQNEAQRFAEALLNPKGPNEELRNAFQNFESQLAE